MTKIVRLHLLCGKIAAGKSTLALRLAEEDGAVLLREDHWLAQLYPDQIKSIADYIKFAGRLRLVVGPLVTSILKSGSSVVLDFPANRPQDRAWMYGLLEDTGADHILHHLHLDDDICKARLRERNAAGKHEFTTSDEQFDQLSQYFVSPSSDEGLNVVTHQ